MKHQDQHRPPGDHLFTRLRAALGHAGRSPYQAFRQVLRELIPLVYRRRIVRFVRRRLRRGWEGSATSYAASLAALAGLLERTAAQRYDIVCFPIINWDFRFQRPQQLMAQLAAAGHRVFYISQEFVDLGPPYELREKRPNVYEVLLRGPDRSVYTDALDPAALASLFASLDALRRNLSLGATVSFVQLPFWRSLAVRARAEFGWPVVYDCMDYHAGFSTNDPEMLREEDDLITEADLTIVSSRFLEREIGARARRSLLVRNGCDAGHFAQVKARPPGTPPVIGYYGAIADWFDDDLVADLAERHPEWSFLLVGSTFSADLRRLGRLPNVRLPGEQPYTDLPGWIDRMDVLLLPFKRTPLTEATNPVKAYEIFAAGKPLVSAPLPEMREMSPPARLAEGVEGFSREIEAALEQDDEAASEARRAFAREHTWERRVRALEPAVRATFPLVSIIVVTYNNLELNRVCLQSLYTNTEWPNFEVIVVDNASTDGTREFLSEAAGKYENLRLVLNDGNRGFAAANNQGIAVARGAFLVLLNNDTEAPRGWLTTLVRHLTKDPGIGLIGPATNEIGNEAKIPVGYANLAGMPAWAAEYVRQHDGEVFEIPMLAMFCVAMRREVCEQVGLLDERFGIGMFEDDDYARRLREAGYRLVCARDSFVHHAGSASFKNLASEEYFNLFERNRKLYEEKWGEVWQPHEDAAAKLRVPALREELLRILSGSKGSPTVVFLPGETWDGSSTGRQQQLARALALEGCLVFFDCSSSQRDDFFGFEPVASRFWLYKGPGGLLEDIPDVIFWASAYHAPLVARWPQARIVYDLPASGSVRSVAAGELLRRAHLVVVAAAAEVGGIEPRPAVVEVREAKAGSPGVRVLVERLRRLNQNI